MENSLRSSAFNSAFQLHIFYLCIKSIQRRCSSNSSSNSSRLIVAAEIYANIVVAVIVR